MDLLKPKTGIYANKKGHLAEHCPQIPFLCFQVAYSALFSLGCLCPEVCQVFGYEAFYVCSLANHFFLGVAHVDVGALEEQLWCACGIVYDEE